MQSLPHTLPSYALPTSTPTNALPTAYPTVLRTPYITPCRLRAPYAMSGTDIGYAATRRPGRLFKSRVASYARPMQCPVLR
eukprot:267245-Rhodomonas_salina.3